VKAHDIPDLVMLRASTKMSTKYTIYVKSEHTLPFDTEIALVQGRLRLCLRIPAGDVELLVPADTVMAVRRLCDGEVLSSAEKEKRTYKKRKKRYRTISPSRNIYR
jgi:hypothetical protein